jgi:hypothetical protein
MKPIFFNRPITAHREYLKQSKVPIGRRIQLGTSEVNSTTTHTPIPVSADFTWIQTGQGSEYGGDFTWTNSSSGSPTTCTWTFGTDTPEVNTNSSFSRTLRGGIYDSSHGGTMVDSTTYKSYLTGIAALGTNWLICKFSVKLSLNSGASEITKDVYVGIAPPPS